MFDVMIKTRNPPRDATDSVSADEGVRVFRMAPEEISLQLRFGHKGYAHLALTPDELRKLIDTLTNALAETGV